MARDKEQAIRAQDPNDPQYYEKSRSTLRELYGSRRIDASPHQSSADTTPSGLKARQTGNQDQTPSGRERYMREQGKTQQEIKDSRQAIWQDTFPQKPMVIPIVGSPMNRMAAPSSPSTNIFAELTKPRQWGAAQTPGVAAGFDLRPTTPPDENGLIRQLSDIPLPKSFYGGAAGARPSILSRANKWLA